MVLISKEKLHVSAYSGHLQAFPCHRPKHAVFLANKHHHLAIFCSCVFD